MARSNVASYSHSANPGMYGDAARTMLGGFSTIQDTLLGRVDRDRAVKEREEEKLRLLAADERADQQLFLQQQAAQLNQDKWRAQQAATQQANRQQTMANDALLLGGGASLEDTYTPAGVYESNPQWGELSKQLLSTTAGSPEEAAVQAQQLKLIQDAQATPEARNMALTETLSRAGGLAKDTRSEIAGIQTTQAGSYLASKMKPDGSNANQLLKEVQSKFPLADQLSVMGDVSKLVPKAEKASYNNVMVPDGKGGYSMTSVAKGTELPQGAIEVSTYNKMFTDGKFTGNGGSGTTKTGSVKNFNNSDYSRSNLKDDAYKKVEELTFSWAVPRWAEVDSIDNTLSNLEFLAVARNEDINSVARNAENLMSNAGWLFGGIGSVDQDRVDKYFKNDYVNIGGKQIPTGQAFKDFNKRDESGNRKVVITTNDKGYSEFGINPAYKEGRTPVLGSGKSANDVANKAVAGVLAEPKEETIASNISPVNPKQGMELGPTLEEAAVQGFIKTMKEAVQPSSRKEAMKQLEKIRDRDQRAFDSKYVGLYKKLYKY